MLIVNHAPITLWKLFQKCAVNLGSLSDTMDIGTSRSQTISQIYNRQNSSNVKVIRIARKCADLVSRSTITHTESWRAPTSTQLPPMAGEPCWLLVLSLNLLIREASLYKVPYVSLHPAPVVLATKITVHLRATWMHNKSRVVKLPEDLLSQIGQLRNHHPSSIPKTTICVDGPALVSHTLLYPVLDEHYLRVLSLGLDHSSQ